MKQRDAFVIVDIINIRNTFQYNAGRSTTNYINYILNWQLTEQYVYTRMAVTNSYVFAETEKKTTAGRFMVTTDQVSSLEHVICEC